MKPILFNTDMVRAILDGRKTVTRRVVKPPVPKPCELKKMHEGYHAGEWHLYCEDPLLDKPFDSPWGAQYLPPFHPGETLYVRETWNYGYIETSDSEYSHEAWFEEMNPLEQGSHLYLDAFARFFYRADEDEAENMKQVGGPWRPSIHMPKKAARLFLRVTGVRAERLQNMSTSDAESEGAETDEWLDLCEEAGVVGLSTCTLREYFGHHIWDRTINGLDNMARYGWDANPWVWVIEFERCKKPTEDKL